MKTNVYLARNLAIIVFLSLEICGLSFPQESYSFAVLDTTTISVNASGSPNTIGGSGVLNETLILPIGSSLEAFEIEFIDFYVSPNIGIPNSHSLEFRYFNPFSTANLNFNWTYIGHTLVVSQTSNSHAFEPLQGFVSGSLFSPPQIYSTICWNSGGGNVNSMSTFEVRALGTSPPAPVPGPSTILLLGSGLVGLLGSRKRLLR